MRFAQILASGTGSIPGNGRFCGKFYNRRVARARSLLGEGKLSMNLPTAVC
jgi:hypothetical protein